MNIYKINKYIKYKFLALSSHGVHSPFVFNFIINVIENKKTTSKSNKLICDLTEFKEVEKKYQNILLNMINYYKYDTIINPGLFQKNTTTKFDLSLLSENQFLNWLEIVDASGMQKHKDSCIAVNNIHNSKLHSDEWEKLYLNPNVKLSIDLFGIGLLFYKEEFKEKQHFILKC